MGRKDDQTNSTADPFGFGSGGFDSPLASKSAKVPSDPFGFGTGGFDPIVEPEEKLTRSAGDVAGDVAITALKGAIGLPEAALGLADVATGGFLQLANTAEELGFRPREAKEMLNEHLSDAQKAANAKVNSANGFTETLKTIYENPSVAATTIGESLPQMIGGAGIARGLLGVLPKVGGVLAAAIGEGAIGAGSAAEQFRGGTEDKRLTPELAGIAAASGVGTGLLGFVGGKLASALKIGDIDTILATGMAQQTTKGFAKQLVAGGISEGLFEELTQSIQEQMWQNFAEGKPITEGVGNAAAQGLVAGAVMGGVGGGYNRILNKPYESDEQIHQHNTLVAGLGKTLMDAKVERDANPQDPKAEENFVSAYSAYVAALTTRPQRNEAADQAAVASAQQVLGATSVEEATAAFNKANEASSILRLGAEAAAAAQTTPAAVAPAAQTTPAAVAPAAQTTPAAVAPAAQTTPAAVAQTTPAATQTEEPATFQGEDEVSVAATAALSAGADSGVVNSIVNSQNQSVLKQAAMGGPSPEIRALATVVLAQRVGVATQTTPAPAATTPAQTSLPLEGGRLNSLPPELSGAKPTHGTTQLTFESDIDKAAYIARNGVKKSKNDAKYVSFVTQATGMTEAEVRAHGEKVAAKIKGGTKVAGQPFNVETVWSAPGAQTTPAAAEPVAQTTPAAVAQGSEPKHLFEMRKALGTFASSLPKHVQGLFSHDFAGSFIPAIGFARTTLTHTKTIPTALKHAGFTQKQWNEFLADLKEKIPPTRTEGVQAQIEKGSTVGQMLDYLVANADPRIGKLAAALKRFGSGNPALDLPYTNLKRPSQSGERGLTKAMKGSGEVTGVENVKGLADELTTLHEITHALTLSWTLSASVADPLYVELTRMCAEARKHWFATGGTTDDLPRGLTDNNEFLAEAQANPQFQEFLMTVPATKAKNGWDKFVGWMRDLLGDPDIDLQMLGQALATVQEISKRSTKIGKALSAKAINPAGQTSVSDADHMGDMATRDLLQSIVADFFKSNDPTAVDDLIATNEMFGGMSLAELRNARTRITNPDFTRLLDAVIARHEAGFDDAFDVINDHITLLEEADMTASMNEALGIDEDDFTIPTDNGETMDDFSLNPVPEHERRAFDAADRLFAAGGHITIGRMINQSEQELNLISRAAGNAARSDLARAMLDYNDITAARVALGNHLNDLMNNDIIAAGLDDRNNRESDPEPSYAKGGRHPIYDFKTRLKGAYMSGALTKLASFWQTVFESDGQFKINVDSKNILRGKESTNEDYSKLVTAYNEAMFEKAKEWAKEHNFPEPKDSPANRVIVSLREQRNGQGKPEIKLFVRGRGRDFRGENPYLATTSEAGEASMDFNPHSKQNEIHASGLEGYEGSGDISYRLFADIANAHGFNLPTADILLTNNNVRRPWQTVAATMRLKNPNVLSPINSGGAASAYGMDTELWPHLRDQERVGANILRHTHNMLVNRPGNRGRSSKIIVSNGRVFDNLAPLPDGSGFIAKFEPNHPDGVPKGQRISFDELETRMRKANAIGGNTDSDIEAGRKGGSGTSMAFALMSQLVLDDIENNQQVDVDPTLIDAGAKMGRNREGWFFDRTDEQKTQLQDEIQAVREFLNDPKNSPEDRAAAREVLRSLLADEIDAKIKTLLEEHASPMTSNGRRGEINRQIAALRMEQRAKRDTMVENLGVIPAEARFDAIMVSDRESVPPIRIRGEHYSHQKRSELLGSKYGTGYKGAERTRIAESDDPRLRNRVHFYADAGKGVRPESGVGGVKHLANLTNVYPAHEDSSIAKSIPNTITGDEYLNAFESAVLDAGYSGYSMPFGQQLAVVMFGTDPIPVLSEEEAGPATPVANRALADNPEAPLLNVGLDVGAGARTMKINPSTARMIIERTGAKILRSNVVASTYTHEDKEITENTLVAELDRPLTETEANEVAKLAQQEAIGQRSPDGNMLYGPKAKEWGAFDPTQFVLLNGTKMSASVETQDADTPVSAADQQVVMHQPVSPAHPNEVRIAAGKAHSILERVSKTVRLHIQDQHVTLGRIVQSLGIKAEDVAMDVIGALTRTRGLVQNNLETLVKDPLAEIENYLFNAGVKDHLAKLDNYLKYRHAEEANIQAAKINPWNETLQKGFNLTDKPGSGILTSDARAELAKLESGPDGAALKEAGRLYNKMIAGLQQYAVERGLEDQDTINAWQNVFPNYAPFNRDLDLVSTFSTGSQGASARAGATQRFMGSKAAIQPILASTRLLGQRIVNRGEAARIGQALLNLATKNTPMFKAGDGKWYPMWKVDTYPNIRTVKTVNVYRFKDINGQYVLNSGGVPLEMYNQNSADAYLAANTNNQNGPKVVEALGPKERVQIIQNPNYIARDNVVIVPVNGENRAVVFNEQSEDAVEMYRNFKDMDTAKLGAMFAVPAIASRWIIATATGYNPVFSLFNFARDMQATAVNMSAENIPGWETSDSVNLLRDSFGNAGPLFKYLEAKYRKTHSNTPMNITPAAGSAAWWMEKAKAAGGLTGVMDSLIGIEEANAQIRELFGVKQASKTKPDPAIEATDALSNVREKLAAAQEWTAAAIEGESKDRVGKIIGAIAVRIANLNSAAELATRTAAFKGAYEKFVAAGKTDAEASAMAANISKGISVNFNRKGQWSARAGALFPFFNASAQGSARLAETIFNKKIIDVPDGQGGSYKKQVTTVTPLGWKLLSALPALGMLQALLLMGYDDDEIPDADKNRTFIIPMPDGGFVKIPLALGMNVPFNMGREGADMIFRPGNRLKHMTNILMQPIEGFNPLGGAGNFIQTIMPAIADPIVGLLQNRDAFNRPIAKEDIDKSKPTPGWTRAKEGATGLSKKLAYGINFLSGGGEFGIGALSPTPDQVDYTLGQITGGLGREVSKGAQSVATAINAATGTPQEETPWYRVPVVGRLYGNVNEPGNVKAQIYADKEQINALDYEHKQMLKAGERERAAELLAEHPEIRLKSRIDSLLREEAELRKQRVKLRANSDVEKVNATNAKIDEKLIKLRDEIRRVKG